MIRRKDDWQENLKAFIDEQITKPFSWGDNDCVSLTLEAIRVQSGLDLKSKIRNYKTKHGAKLVLKKYSDEGTLEAGFSKFLEDNGFKEINPKKAKRGTPIMYNCPNNGYCCGVVGLDGRFAIFKSDAVNLLKIPVALCSKAWELE